MDIWKISSLYGDCSEGQMCHDKTTFRLKTDPSNKVLNSENGLIVFSSSSSTHRHTSTRSCSNIYSRLWGLSVATFRIFEDFRGFWLGTSNIYPGYPAENIWDFPMNFFFKNQKSVTVVLQGNEFRVVLPWQNFRKLSSFSINGRIWLTCRLCVLVQYVMTKSEFWFSMMWPSYRHRNVPSSVLLNLAVYSCVHTLYMQCCTVNLIWTKLAHQDRAADARGIS
jgi:hypothetical protein